MARKIVFNQSQSASDLMSMLPLDRYCQLLGSGWTHALSALDDWSQMTNAKERFPISRIRLSAASADVFGLPGKGLLATTTSSFPKGP